MPKRAPTPPPPDDEPRYLTVAFPYPPHGNMELVQDCAEASRWLACITGKDSLIALFHKPSSPNMIIIEVERNFGEWSKLLGAHAWSEVFPKCDPKDKARKSQIYWCTFNTGRQVQKYGWKRVYVDEKWFTHWRVPNSNVAYPYPATTYCDVPREDRTNAPLCRPLPVADFPQIRATPARPPPVGSAEWAVAKQVPAVKIDPKIAWGRTPHVGLSPAPVARPPIMRASTSGSGSGTGSVMNTAAANTPIANVPPGLPPLNMPYSPGQGSPAWDGVPGLVHGNSGSGSGSDDNSSDTIGRTPPPSTVPEVFVAGDSFEDAMADLAVHDPVIDEEDGDDVQGVHVSGVVELEPAEPAENLWADYVNPDDPVEDPEDEIVCPAHGKLCGKGICKEYRRLKRAIERKKEEAERAAAILEKKKQKKSKGKEKETDSEATKISYSTPRRRYDQKVAPTPEPTTTTTTTTTTTPAPARAKPSHLMKPASLNGPDSAGTSRPARGRKMNSNPVKSPISPVSPRTAPKANDARSAADHSEEGWGRVYNGIRGGTDARAAQDDDARSAAASSASGWGHLSQGPWDGKGTGRPGNNVRTPAVAVDDDARSVAASSASGWGNLSQGPWGGRNVAGPSAAPEDDARSVAASSASGWGNLSQGPWGGRRAGAPSVAAAEDEEDDDNSTINGSDHEEGGKSWADQVEEEEAETRSVAASSSSGWGALSNGPW